MREQFGGGGNLNPLNTALNPTYHLLAVLGAHHILHVSRVRVNVSVSALVGLLLALSHKQ